MSTPFAKLKISLNFPLNSYNTIKDFLDAMREIFPEQTAAYCGNSWEFIVKEGYATTKYSSGTDFLNAYYRAELIPLNTITLHNFSQNIALSYFAYDPANVLILWGKDRSLLEDVEQKILKAVSSMGNVAGTNTQTTISQEDFLGYTYDDLSFSDKIFSPKLVEIISGRMTEINIAMANKIPLAAIFLMGSTLEGILLALANAYPEKFNQSTSVPKDKYNKVKPFSAWSLNNYIDVAFDLKIFDLNVKKFSHELRNFRNYIHPYEQLQNNFSPNIITAQIGLQVLKAAVSQINDFVCTSERTLSKRFYL